MHITKIGLATLALTMLPMAIPGALAEELASSTPEGVLDEARLGRMLEGMGYEPQDLGDCYYRIRFERDDWTFVLDVSVSQDRQYFWVMATVARWQDPSLVPSARLVDLLASHDGPFHFYVLRCADRTDLRAGQVLPNRGVEPADMRGAIDDLVTHVRDTQETWSAATETKPAETAAKAQDAPGESPR